MKMPRRKYRAVWVMTGLVVGCYAYTLIYGGAYATAQRPVIRSVQQPQIVTKLKTTQTTDRLPSNMSQGQQQKQQAVAQQPPQLVSHVAQKKPQQPGTFAARKAALQKPRKLVRPTLSPSQKREQFIQKERELQIQRYNNRKRPQRRRDRYFKVRSVAQYPIIQLDASGRPIKRQEKKINKPKVASQPKKQAPIKPAKPVQKSSLPRQSAIKKVQGVAL